MEYASPKFAACQHAGPVYTAIVGKLIPYLRRALLMLCIATACISAGSAVGHAIDSIEHETGMVHAHSAVGLATLTIDADHDHDHEAISAPGDDNSPQDAIRHHHHHGEFASGLIDDIAWAHVGAGDGVSPAALAKTFVLRDSPGSLKRPPRAFAATV